MSRSKRPADPGPTLPAPVALCLCGERLPWRPSAQADVSGPAYIHCAETCAGCGAVYGLHATYLDGRLTGIELRVGVPAWVPS